MARKFRPAVTVVAVAMLLVAGNGYAAPAKGVKIGDAAPDWSAVVGVDDNKHALADYSKAKLIVMAFTCNHCPVAVAYEDRLIALQDDYRKKGVQVIAINVNNNAADRLEPMKKRAKDKKFNFPYVYDSSQQTGHDYGATCTPHVFVLCKGRKIAYAGAIDDNNNPKKVKATYLRDALDALLSDKTPDPTQTTQRGCGIKWDKK